MSRSVTEHPTQLELEILSIIWRDGPSTVRQVRDALAPTRDLAFTSVLTTMKTMVKKGYLAGNFRSQKDGGTLYTALVARDRTGAQMIKLLARRIFGGSIVSAVQSLLREGTIQQEEIDELRNVLSKDTRRRRK